MTAFPAFVAAELVAARAAHADMHTGHEALGIILEEFDEFKEEVRSRVIDPARAMRELVQIAAMCQRAAEDLGWVVTARADGGRAERMAAYLYGRGWVPGQRSWQDIPQAARRQWFEQANEVLQLLDAA